MPLVGPLPLFLELVLRPVGCSVLRRRSCSGQGVASLCVEVLPAACAFVSRMGGALGAAGGGASAINVITVQQWQYQWMACCLRNHLISNA